MFRFTGVTYTLAGPGVRLLLANRLLSIFYYFIFGETMNIYVATDLKRQKKTDYHIEEFENYIVQVIHVNCIS